MCHVDKTNKKFLSISIVFAQLDITRDWISSKTTNVLITHKAPGSTEYFMSSSEKKHTFQTADHVRKQVTTGPAVLVGGHVLNLSIPRRQKLVLLERQENYFLGRFLRSLNRSCCRSVGAIADLPDITYAYHPLFEEKDRNTHVINTKARIVLVK